MNEVELRVHHVPGTGSLARSKGFEHKGLATHGANVGHKCGHECAYCSSASMYRHRSSFTEVGESAFGRGFAIVDPDMPERLDESKLGKLRETDMVQVCTASDAWAPGTGDVGRRLMEHLLLLSDAQVRILTKNALVARDFDLIEEFPERVTLGLSLTGTPFQDGLVKVIEPNASLISERVAVLQDAKQRGLRVYGMLCPLLPGIAEDHETIAELLGLCAELGVEDLWAEPVNGRGKGLIWTAEDLAEAGHQREAEAIDAVRHKTNWSPYVRRLVDTLVEVADDLGLLDRLHVLLYPKNLIDEDAQALRRHERGIIWL